MREQVHGQNLKVLRVLAGRNNHYAPADESSTCIHKQVCGRNVRQVLKQGQCFSFCSVSALTVLGVNSFCWPEATDIVKPAVCPRCSLARTIVARVVPEGLSIIWTACNYHSVGAQASACSADSEYTPRQGLYFVIDYTSGVRLALRHPRMSDSHCRSLLVQHATRVL